MFQPNSPEFSTPSSPISLYDDIATSLILQPAIMSTNDKLTQALAAMERMEKLTEALNNDLETVKEETCYLKVVVETNNNPTNPDHPLYEPPTNDPIPASHFSPPPIHIPPPPSEKPRVNHG